MFFFMVLNNSLKSYVFWRSSSLKSIFLYPLFSPLDPRMAWNKKNVYIDEVYNKLKIEVLVWCLHFLLNITLKKTLYQTSVKCLQGIILFKCLTKILIQLQVKANCDHCTNPLVIHLFMQKHPSSSKISAFVSNRELNFCTTLWL